MSNPKEKEEQGIVLPTKPSNAILKSPKNLIIFAKPKVGKTSAFAQLKNWLILDLEDGSDYVDCMAMKAKTVDEIADIMKAIKLKGNPYAGIVIDTATSLEEICIPYAERLYARTSMGKNWFLMNGEVLDATSGKAQYGTILNLPMGAGYQYLRQAFTKMIDMIWTSAPRVIISCHVKEIYLDKKGVEFSAVDLNLTGKIKTITSSNSDAIGYLYRKGNQNIVSFETTDAVNCGARPTHLRNKQIVLSELNDDVITTHWDKIYID